MPVFAQMVAYIYKNMIQILALNKQPLSLENLVFFSSLFADPCRSTTLQKMWYHIQYSLHYDSI